MLGYIPAGKTDTALSHYIVPAEYEAAIHEMYVGASDSGDMKVTFQYRLPDQPWQDCRPPIDIRGIQASLIGMTRMFPALTCFRARGRNPY